MAPPPPSLRRRVIGAALAAGAGVLGLPRPPAAMLPDCHNRLLFLRNPFLRRRDRLQGDVNRIGCESRRSACALSLRTHRYCLQLVAAQRERHGELAAGLDRELAGRATALTQGRFRFCPWRFGLNRQHLRLRSGLHEIQARHRCGTCGQREATRNDGNKSAHDPHPLGGIGAASPQSHGHRVPGYSSARHLPRLP